MKEHSQICNCKIVKPRISRSRINKNNIQKLRNETDPMQFFSLKRWLLSMKYSNLLCTIHGRVH